MRSNRILYLVDKVDYVQSNCFQRQLLAACHYCADIELLPVYPSKMFGFRKILARPNEYKSVVSVLRLRTLHQIWPSLKTWLNGCPITIYDQDPWESYIDSAPTKGVYHTLRDNLNIRSVYVTADWWAKRLALDGVPAEFVRMGIEPRWCDPGPDYLDRDTLIGFKGSVHPHRARVFERMLNVGVKVDVSLAHLNYHDYMAYLQTLKIFTHDESEPWICDGAPVSRSTGMWVKSLETAACGTFVLRNYHEEGESYNVSAVPLIQYYKTPEEARDIIERIEGMDPLERRAIQIESVNEIRRRYDWLETAQKLLWGGSVQS